MSQRRNLIPDACQRSKNPSRQRSAAKKPFTTSCASPSSRSDDRSTYAANGDAYRAMTCWRMSAAPASPAASRSPIHVTLVLGNRWTTSNRMRHAGRPHKRRQPSPGRKNRAAHKASHKDRRHRIRTDHFSPAAPIGCSIGIRLGRQSVPAAIQRSPANRSARWRVDVSSPPSTG